MRIYDLTFADNKRCRCIAMDASETEEQDINSIRQGFHPGYVSGVDRIVPPIPDVLPWKRDGQVWRLHQFELSRLSAGQFELSWPGGSMRGSKDEVRQAVVDNWRSGC